MKKVRYLVEPLILDISGSSGREGQLSSRCLSYLIYQEGRVEKVRYLVEPLILDISGRSGREGQISSRFL